MSSVAATAKPRTMREMPAEMSPTISAEMPKDRAASPELPSLLADLLADAPAMAQESWKAMRLSAERTFDIAQRGYSAAANDSLHYTLKLSQSVKDGMAGTMQLISALMAAKSPADVIEASRSHAERQFKVMLDRNVDLWMTAQNLARLAGAPVPGAEAAE